MSTYPVPVAKQSPRIEKGTLYFYLGDVFTIKWNINIKDDGEPYVFTDGDKLTFSFYQNNTLKHSFSFTNNDITDNAVILDFTKLVSNKFTVGKYNYCLKFECHDGRVATLNAVNKLEVQPCH